MSFLRGELVAGRQTRAITIGQLAAYAGVTIKAIRHYHKRGLLAEPPRDSSGYRRYSVQHAIDLVKIKTLGEAGVPLTRIKELLAVDADRFSARLPRSTATCRNGPSNFYVPASESPNSALGTGCSSRRR